MKGSSIARERNIRFERAGPVGELVPENILYS